MTEPAAGDQGAARRARVAAAFTAIAEQRMAGLPFVNPALAVAALGFEPVAIAGGAAALGVLACPWAMNLMLLPLHDGAEDPRFSAPVGAQREFALPAGPYEWVAGEAPALGPYWSCSLFSPVFEFADQASFVATAEAALAAVLDGANREQLGSEEWPAPASEPAPSDAGAEPAAAPEAGEPQAQGIDRRGFLRRVGGVDERATAAAPALAARTAQ